MAQHHSEQQEDAQAFSDSFPLRILDLATLVEKAWAETLAPHALTPPEFRVLVIVTERRQCTATEIGALAPVDPSSISRIVHRLVQRRLVTRRRSQADRRIVSLRASAEGQRLIRQLAQPLHDLANRLISEMSEAEFHTFTNATSAMRVLLSSPTPDPDQTQMDIL